MSKCLHCNGKGGGVGHSAAHGEQDWECEKCDGTGLGVEHFFASSLVDDMNEIGLCRSTAEEQYLGAAFIRAIEFGKTLNKSEGTPD